MIDRKSKSYEITCPSCEEKRMVTYAQSWNIRVGNSSGNCKKCMSHTGGKKGQIPWNKGLLGFNKGHIPYFVAKGEENPAWKGGVTSENAKIRNSREYAEWRKAVFERDDYTCQECGQLGGQLHADHILPFAYFPESRLDINNGRALCVPCHKATDTYLSGSQKKYAIRL